MPVRARWAALLFAFLSLQTSTGSWSNSLGVRAGLGNCCEIWYRIRDGSCTFFLKICVPNSLVGKRLAPNRCKLGFDLQLHFHNKPHQQTATLGEIEGPLQLLVLPAQRTLWIMADSRTFRRARRSLRQMVPSSRCERWRHRRPRSYWTWRHLG